MPLRLNKRTLALGAVASSLVVATVYDLSVGFGDKPGRARGVESTVGAAARVLSPAPNRVPGLAREVAELEHFLAAAPVVRARYQAIAVPYAEAVAGMATLHVAGESLPELARARVAALLPPPVKLEAMLVSQPAAAARGVARLTANVSLSSDDSDAFSKALLKLGDAANGMAWKELTVVSDPERRSLRASGQLALLMIQQAE